MNRRSVPGLPDYPWIIPNAHCVNCGGVLGWVEGIGRLVVGHASDGSSRCPTTAVRIHDGDLEAAQEVYAEMDRRYTASLL